MNHTNFFSLFTPIDVSNKGCIYARPNILINSNDVTTVEYNMVVFTIRHIDRYKLSSKIYRNLGLPTVNTFKHMVSTNVISKCPISLSDIINAERKVSKESNHGAKQVQ